MPGNLFSTGGDEVNAACFADDAETQMSLNATGMNISQALNNFVGATHSALRAQGKTPVVWEEMVLSENITLGADTVVMYVYLFSLSPSVIFTEAGYPLQCMDFVSGCGCRCRERVQACAWPIRLLLSRLRCRRMDW